MKTGIIVFLLLFGLASNAFPQASLNSFYNDWDITIEKLKSDFKDKNIIESKGKELNMLSYEDVLDKIQVRVDFVFNKKGRLTGKTIGAFANEKDYKPLFDIFKNDAVKRCGDKFTHQSLNGKNLITWLPDENTKVIMIYDGRMVQYNIMKKVKAKDSK